MKIVVIGGSGLIGSNIVNSLRLNGYDTVVASPSTGVNSITGEGLAEAFTGAQVVVDVSNSPSFEDKAVLEFFETSTRNMLAAETKAGVTHHLALSVVGTDRLPENGYFRAKLAQENLIRASHIPYTILRSTQFFEFIESIISGSAEGDTVRLSPALIQAIAAEDVSAVLAELAVSVPVNGIVDVAGPTCVPLDEIARIFLAASADKRQVIADVHARYFGSKLDDRSLIATGNPRIGQIHFQDWLKRSSALA